MMKRRQDSSSSRQGQTRSSMSETWTVTADDNSESDSNPEE